MHDNLTQLPRTEPHGPGRLRPVAPRLWATPDEPLGDGPAHTCGFLLQRDEGNVFVYSCSAISDFYDHIDELGGVAMTVLNHRDEATRHVTRLADHYRIPVRTHINEVQACQRRQVRDIEPITDSETRLAPDLLALHAPGHTPGTVAYLWTNPADSKRYVFTGDTFTNFTLDRFPAVLSFHSYEGNVDDMRTTLDRLDAEPSDMICPGLMGGTIHAFAWDEPGRHVVIDYARQQLPDGSTHRPG
jgi:hypothetical protein